jgi:glycosyltransferase involved in cell wall biosynthesis
MKSSDPVVSVIIPTRNRPQLVIRAAKSALQQTLDAIEVIVVIDGPDEETLKTLLQIEDPRLRVVMLPSHLGAGGARNAGVKEARSQWIAFLDDDDEWLPQKLEIQLQTAERSPHLYPIISCRFIARSESGDLIWPRRYPKPDEPISEYLFCQSGLFGGEGFIAITTILIQKKLLNRVPFIKGVLPYEDWGWFLQTNRIEGTGVEFISKTDPLAIWHMEENRSRMSNQTDWQYSLSWLQANQHLFTKRAYTSFIMTQVSLHAARTRDWRAFWFLPWKAYQHRRPRLIDLLAHILIWSFPTRMRKKWVILYDRIRTWI